MATFFVVSDVHSFYDEMIQALEENNFDINNKNHVFVSLGDLLDRGPKPRECLQFVNKLSDNRKILIKGNHERLLQECIERKEFLSHDYHNKTIDTVMQLTKSITFDDPFRMLSKVEFDADWNQYINSCIDYYETTKYIFVHGWIPCIQLYSGKNLYGEEYYNYLPIEDWRNGPWDIACWLNGMDCWDKGIRIANKIILCGHYHSSWGNSILHGDGIEIPETSSDFEKWNYTPFKDDGIICLDSCTVLSGKVNCVKIDKQKKLIKED